MMFVWGQPLEVKAAADVFDISKQEAYELFKELRQNMNRKAAALSSAK